jgi:hypothetical protein
MVIGRYKLLQEIGEGGFGIVFMAEQTEPVQRKVALKIIKAGMDTREVIARFEAERQALALMDHPNIAKVLDAGTTETGRPYFVMELVRGLPITDYCDQANLSTRERLELFIKVCHAIQHAHQKGIIHRDLKPSNVLVTLHDGEPVPKVIDFGVAKALGQKLTHKTLFTRFEQMIGTPAYMSPEQAALGGLDIDTRSDVYSLGVLLYELLTGATPLDAETLRQGALDEIRRMIRETEPPKPSTRLLELGGRVTEVARHRGTEPAALSRLIRGDLDWIVMKCLEKDRARRYDTANSLANDVQLHLNCEPVIARPPSRLYEFQKTVRRHKFGFAAAGAVVGALLLGLAASTWLLLEQTAARKKAEAAEKSARSEVEKNQLDLRIIGDMVAAMIRASPSPAVRKDLTAAIDRVVERLDASLTGKPEIQAHLRMVCGLAYAEVEEPENAEAMLRKVIELRAKVSGETSLDIAISYQRLGAWRSQRGELPGAEAMFRNSVEAAKKVSGGVNGTAMDSLNWLGLTLFRQWNFSGAAATYREALMVRRKLLPNDPAVAAGVASGLYGNLADALRFQARYDELKGLGPEAAKDYSYKGQGLTSLAWLWATGEEPQLRDGPKALALAEQAARVTNRKDPAVLNVLAAAYAENQQFANAIRVQEEALALSLFKEHCKALLELYRNNEPCRSPAPMELFQALGAQGKLAEARAIYLATLQDLHARFPTNDPRLDDPLVLMTQRLLNAEMFAEAETVARESLANREQNMPDQWPTFHTRSVLGGIFSKEKKYAQAEPLLISGYQGLKQREHKLNLEGRFCAKGSVSRLVEFYEQTHQSDQAAEWKDKLGEFDHAGPLDSITPRDPGIRVNPNLIDLSSFYNATLTAPWHEPRSVMNDLSELPHGIRTFAGVQFDVRGLIQLDPFPERERYPDEVRNIPVHRICRRLHFLHAAINGGYAPDGAKIGSYIIHYASGPQSELPIIMGQSLADWWTQPNEQGKTFTIAWEGQNAESRRQGKTIRLFKSTWENLAPSDTVSTIDFIGYQKGPAPFLVAVTAEP